VGTDKCIVQQGEVSESFYVLLKGAVEVHIKSPQGKDTIYNASVRHCRGAQHARVGALHLRPLVYQGKRAYEYVIKTHISGFRCHTI
jgi:CRP-like cAMP-binding protein